jgi:hypothetical protein
VAQDPLKKLEAEINVQMNQPVVDNMKIWLDELDVASHKLKKLRAQTKRTNKDLGDAIDYLLMLLRVSRGTRPKKASSKVPYISGGNCSPCVPGAASFTSRQYPAGGSRFSGFGT